MKFFYIIISSAFAAAMDGRESPVNKGSYFGYSVTTTGMYVTGSNSVNDFPGAFDSLANSMPDSSLTMIILKSSDFPPTPPIK